MQESVAETKPSRFKTLYKINAASSLMTGILLLLAMLSLTVTNSASSSIENNWLVILYKINAGYDEFSYDRLQGVYLLNVAILILAGMTFLGIAIAHQHAARIWSFIAAAFPFVGIIFLLITKLAGRSGLMGGVIIISCVLLRSKLLGKNIPWLGIVGSILLLIGDFGTNPNIISPIIAASVAIGYILLMVWFFWVAIRLSQIKQFE